MSPLDDQSNSRTSWLSSMGIIALSMPDLKVVGLNRPMAEMIGKTAAFFKGKGFADALAEMGGRLSLPDQPSLSPDQLNQQIISSVQSSAQGVALIVQLPGQASHKALMVPLHIFERQEDPAIIVCLFHDLGLAGAEMPLDLQGMHELQKAFRKKSGDLKSINAQLEAMYNASSESIWVLSGNGSVVSINKAGETLLGVRAEEVVGKRVEELVAAGFIDQSVTRQVLDTGRQVSLLQSTRKTGKQLLVTGTPVFDENGNISMVIVNERDMTRLTKLQEQLQRVKEEKNRINTELNQLSLQGLKENEIIAHAKEMQDLLVVCRKLADMNVSSILIMGESGTGKGLLAKYIHNCNALLKGPLVKINCAAVPETLLEAELFGYEPGAFTGAKNEGKIGLFEAAKNGTLFLDEIGELSLPLQAKLLTCLEEREIMHIGGLKPIKINCSIIAATNEDLERKVAAKQFRQDLYFRLNAFPLTIPPLRHRPEDIMELTLHFLDKYNRAYNRACLIPGAELNRIQAYQFPGNVRELKNCIRRAVVMAEKNTLEGIVGNPVSKISSHAGTGKKGLGGLQNGFNRQVADFEKQLLVSALEKWGTTRALATGLDMTQSQVVRKLKKYGLSHLLAQKM
ncbi:MAG: sigma 54-interacting transcriptional regulator [Desulfobacterales bacterium]|nr:sigma 54-interacting transcriptional regulator [Desulfobacterales bacterium]